MVKPFIEELRSCKGGEHQMYFAWRSQKSWVSDGQGTYFMGAQGRAVNQYQLLSNAFKSDENSVYCACT